MSDIANPPSTHPDAFAILGPTASGKSRLAMAIARHVRVEIISVDSAQVYRDMDVGTAKPSFAERDAVPHHLIDVIDPTERYSAARFRTDALRLVDEIQARGRLPLLVGGTMLYIKALREGLSSLPGADLAIRAAIDQEAVARGWPALHAELREHDPLTAARLSPNDSQRIQRALEVFRISGAPLSEHFVRDAVATPSVGLRVLALIPSDRALLHRHIAERFDRMLDEGLVTEVARLREKYPLHAGLPSMRCVGYRQAWDFLDGAIDRPTLREQGIAATRQLAKRQLTWLRSMPDMTPFDSFSPQLEGTVLAAIECHLTTRI
ncbi:MAG: tRNA (adenosine(37)-N6)-dimethylallyltransferase MiaA [Burkholderiales bacterium]